jgi:hypothetical protein
MATLALSAVGASLGSALLPTGLSFLGTTIAGATIGSQLGALAGAQIDQALFGSSGQRRAVDGPRLSDLRVTASTEGAPIPRLYGRARLGGQVIWATALEEEAVSNDAGGGGKGGSAQGASAGVDYRYFANFAVGLCEGEVTALGRVWADGREIDLSDYTWRLHTGRDTQLPDDLIVAKQGADSAPAYRGLAYIVFERLPLAGFGNRIPQLSFEVSRAVDSVEASIRGVCLIPGSGEFVYSPTEVRRTVNLVQSVAENVHTRLGGTDYAAALDQLQSHLPNAKSVSLIVSWFGNDLRADHCQLRPLVETHDKETAPTTWSVAGLTRATAAAVSTIDGRAAYGGTPSDDTIVAAIRDLDARGLSVVFSPFVLMDIPAGNARPDPYSNATTQPAHPWRGRITVAPAPGRPGTPDKTATAASHIAAFVGTAQPSHFAIAGDSVVYSGPAEWSFRRFILHYAYLCKAAGGVDAFVLCSELRGLTTLRGASNSFPFVATLVQLAAEVRSILGPTTKILYAADWSEYFGHQPADGSGDVFFHLDPLWSSPDIDAIGLDVYWPLADWRDGDAHLDTLAGHAGTHDLAYLKSRLFAGEGFDWYYASPSDRDAQIRTPITDGAGKSWVFRYKDIGSWWSNPHFDRPGGIESSTPTAWVPQSKPFWLMEIGCPAIDKGANQPNVFIDAKSSESFIPHYSSGARDDLIQRRLIQAFTEAFDPAHPGHVAGANPVSAVTGARMLDIERIHVYCWDARPHPAFPNDTTVWQDAANWERGHWITGRTAAAPVPALVARLLADYGFADFDASALTATASGLVLDRIMSAREALQTLELAFFFDTLESAGRIVFRPRGAASSGLLLTPDDLVEARPGAPLMRLTRAQETDLPAAAKLTYLSSTDDYPQAVAEARRLVGASGRISTAALGLVLDPAEAQAIAESWLFEAWAARERAAFALPPSLIALEPGDLVTLDTGTRRHVVRITEIGDHGARDIDARAIDPTVYRATPAAARPPRRPRETSAGPPLAIFLDVPPGDDAASETGLVAVAQEPWPGTVAIYRSPETTGFTLDTLVLRAAVVGTTASPLSPHHHSRLDHATRLTVTLARGELTSATELAFLGGANTAAIEVSSNVWELVQFRTATLTSPGTYVLSDLLRGLRGTTSDVATPAGARFVLLDTAVRPLALAAADLGRPFHWKIGPANRDIGDASYATAQQTFTGRGLEPLSPVHIRGTRAPNGDLTLTWVRRTRTGGDNWDTLEVPLGETEERYEVDIFAGATVKRTLSTTSPTALYSAAQQATDFGSPQSALTVRIAQLSPTRGRGTATTAVI